MTPASSVHYCHYLGKPCDEAAGIRPERGLFFAYPSKPESAADAMRGAAGLIMGDKSLNVPVVDWSTLPIEGNVILCEICKAIRGMTCAVINTTYVNFNVLFEYGMAIGTGRAIWPLVEEGVSRDELVSTNVKSITTIGYSHFSNSNAIYKKIVKKAPWERSSHFDLPPALGTEPSRAATGVLYVKALQNNEPSLRISEVLSTLRYELTADDPNEVPFHHVAWYLTQIGKSYAVMINLGNERVVGSQLQSAKCALVAGMALALGRRVCILGETLSAEPIDYRDLLQSYKNAHEAETLTKRFLATVVPDLDKFRDYTISDLRVATEPDTARLASANLGDCVAENEQPWLQTYFVETPEFASALQSKCTVFVGRKGSGKTANFFIWPTAFSKTRKRSCALSSPRNTSSTNWCNS